MKRTETRYLVINRVNGDVMLSLKDRELAMKAVVGSDEFTSGLCIVTGVLSYDDGKPAKPSPRRAKLAKPSPGKSGASGNPSPQSAARRKAIMLTPPAKRGGTKGKGGAK